MTRGVRSLRQHANDLGTVIRGVGLHYFGIHRRALGLRYVDWSGDVTATGRYSRRGTAAEMPD